MHASLTEMAQLTLGTDAVMDAAVALRAQLKEQWATAGLSVPSITDLIVRAAALALRDHPRLNATVRDNAIHVQPDINVGIAVALDDGLMVPVVKHADRSALSTIAAETRRLSQAARTNTLGLPDLEGGTFTVSTLGTLRHRLLHPGHHARARWRSSVSVGCATRCAGRARSRVAPRC